MKFLLIVTAFMVVTSKACDVAILTTDMHECYSKYRLQPNGPFVSSCQQSTLDPSVAVCASAIDHGAVITRESTCKLMKNCFLTTKTAHKRCVGFHYKNEYYPAGTCIYADKVTSEALPWCSIQPGSSDFSASQQGVTWDYCNPQCEQGAPRCDRYVSTFPVNGQISYCTPHFKNDSGATLSACMKTDSVPECAVTTDGSGKAITYGNCERLHNCDEPTVYSGKKCVAFSYANRNYPAGTCTYIDSFNKRPWCSIEPNANSFIGYPGEYNWDECPDSCDPQICPNELTESCSDPLDNLTQTWCNEYPTTEISFKSNATPPVTETVQLCSSNRIVGGQPAQAHEFPWLAALIESNSQSATPFCGGSIINKRWVLTAAHCVCTFNCNDFFIRVGEHDLSTFEGPERDFAVKRIVRHPDLFARNDYALLEVYFDFVFNDFVKPVVLPKYTGFDFADATGSVYGWGIKSDGTTATILQKVDLSVLAHGQCMALSNSINPMNELCAYGYNGQNRDSCQGDSGGPLTTCILSNGVPKYVQIGVISWGPNWCGQPEYPGVYGRVAEAVAWINCTVGGDVLVA